jgi:prepilin-type processing-associated H-X9-DG protein
MTQASDSAKARPAATCDLAIVSLLCGLLGPCTLGVAAIVGMILGIVALFRISTSGGALKGKGLAIAGIIISGIGLVLGVAVLVVVAMASYWPKHDMAVPREMKRALPQESGDPGGETVWNLHFLAQAAIGGAPRNDGRLPEARQWSTRLRSYLGPGADDILGWPKRSGDRFAYSMNRLLDRIRPDEIKHPERTVLFFLSEAHGPPAGGPGHLANLNGSRRGPPRFAVSFADGHVEEIVCPRHKLNLYWHPDGNPRCPQCGHEFRLDWDWRPPDPIVCPKCSTTLWDEQDGMLARRG